MSYKLGEKVFQKIKISFFLGKLVFSSFFIFKNFSFEKK